MEYTPLPQEINVNTLLEELVQPRPVVIGLEGGPCSGKSTLMAEIAHQAEETDRIVVTLPEAATEHITRVTADGRSMPEIIADRPAFLQLQRDILRTIIANIDGAVSEHAGTDAIILVDRPDVGGYITPDEYRQVLRDIGEDRPPLHSRVDKLVFLPSVASETPERYAELRGTNVARYEATAAAAAAVCAANLRAVRTHPELQMAWGGSFQEKIRRLAETVLQPELEGEIKQGVPHTAALSYVTEAARRGDLLNSITMEQSYHVRDGREFRLRRATGDDGYEHRYFTIKHGEGAFRREIQRPLDEDQYSMLASTEQQGKTLKKVRHVVLDEPDSAGKRRLWFADRYVQPELAEWHFETEVNDEVEVEELTVLYGALRRRITESAKALIFN